MFMFDVDFSDHADVDVDELRSDAGMEVVEEAPQQLPWPMPVMLRQDTRSGSSDILLRCLFACLLHMALCLLLDYAGLG